MKAPDGLSPEIRTVLEIVQHCGEILSRLPLRVLQVELAAVPVDAWTTCALRAARAAEVLELAVADLTAEEAHAVAAPAAWPDDALPSA